MFDIDDQYSDYVMDQDTAVMQALAFQNSLLFIGCGEGLKDPNFSNLLAWLERVKGESEYRNYRLALSSEVETQKEPSPEGDGS